MEVSNGRSVAEEFLIAGECDARGDHDNAINALARATQSGDVEATMRLGKRLITGVCVAQNFQESLRLLTTAAMRGWSCAAQLVALAPPMRGEKWIVSQFVRSRRALGAVG